MDFATLTQRRAELATKLDAIEAAAAENDNTWTDDQRAEYDALLEQQDAVRQDIERHTRRAEAERVMQRHDRNGVRMAGRWGDPGDDDPEPVAAKTPIVYHGLPMHTEAEAARYAFGQQLLDVYKAAAQPGHVSDRLMQIQAAAQGAGEKVGSDAGFLVQTDVGGMLVREVMQGRLLQDVNQVPISPNSNGITFQAVDEKSRATGSRWGGVQGYWVDEGTAPTATSPTYRKIELKLNKVAALGYATEELIEDGVAIGSVFFQAFAEELRFLVENAIMNGTGAGQPEGVLTSAALVTQAKQTGQAASTIVKQNIDKMYARRWARSTDRMRWYYNQDIEPQLEELSMNVGTGGVPVYLPPGGIADTPNSRIKGRPSFATEYNATLGTVGDIVLADLSQYLFIARQVQSASSMHVRFTTDEMAFRVTWRVDGRMSWVSAMTPFKGANTQSPIVALATRS